MQDREIIGRGRTAEVLAWTPGYVLKLYYSWWPIAKIEYEAQIGRAVHAAGIPAPQVGDLVEVEGRHGLLYERISGQSIEDILRTQPDRHEELALSLAQLHASLHAKSAGELATAIPTGRSRLTRAIESVDEDILNANLKEKVLGILNTLPGGDSICHGDFHPGNILMSNSTQYIIDWENINLGNPLADVARTSLLFDTAHLSSPDLAHGEARALVDHFRDLYIAEYTLISNTTSSMIHAWRVPVAAARLHEGIAEEQAYLLDIIQISQP